VVGDALRFDRSGVVVLDAARMAVGTTIPLVVGYLAGSWAAGAAAAGGALRLARIDGRRHGGRHVRRVREQ
jgi:hypothetical protein